MDDPLSPARSLDFDSLDRLLSARTGNFVRLESVTLELVADKSVGWGQPEVTLHEGLLRKTREAGLLRFVYSPTIDYSEDGEWPRFVETL